MLTVMFYLKSSYKRLMNIKDKLQKEIDILKRREEREQQGKKNRDRTDLDLEDIQKPLANAFLDLAMVVEECKLISTSYMLAPVSALSALMPMIEKRLDEAHTAEEIVDTLKMIEEIFEPWISNTDLDDIGDYYYEPSFRDSWCRGYSTGCELSESAIGMILSRIFSKRQYINILEISCKQGYLAQRAKELLGPTTNMYGVDIYEEVGRNMRQYYKRCIYGSLTGALISRDAFDLLFCLPKITIRQELQNNVYVKNERDTLFRSLEYLRVDGTLVYAIPYFRFYREICDHLAKYYTDFQIFTTSEDLANTLVIVVCKKLKEPLTVPDRSVYNRLRLLSRHHELEDILWHPELQPIRLPDIPVEVKKFRGSKLNEEEVADLYKTSHTTQAFWKDQAVEKLGDSKVRPLLPFNVGQLGLILTSGCLDGVIDEKNGYCHAVKGRVIKRTNVSENSAADSRQIQLISTTGNRVEINVFLPDGTYKCLA